MRQNKLPTLYFNQTQNIKQKSQLKCAIHIIVYKKVVFLQQINNQGKYIPMIHYFNRLFNERYKQEPNNNPNNTFSPSSIYQISLPLNQPKSLPSNNLTTNTQCKDSVSFPNSQHKQKVTSPSVSQYLSVLSRIVTDERSYKIKKLCTGGQLFNDRGKFQQLSKQFIEQEFDSKACQDAISKSVYLAVCVQEQRSRDQFVVLNNNNNNQKQLQKFNQLYTQTKQNPATNNPHPPLQSQPSLQRFSVIMFSIQLFQSSGNSIVQPKIQIFQNLQFVRNMNKGGEFKMKRLFSYFESKREVECQWIGVRNDRNLGITADGGQNSVGFHNQIFSSQQTSLYIPATNINRDLKYYFKSYDDFLTIKLWLIQKMGPKVHQQKFKQEQLCHDSNQTQCFNNDNISQISGSINKSNYVIKDQHDRRRNGFQQKQKQNNSMLDNVRKQQQFQKDKQDRLKQQWRENQSQNFRSERQMMDEEVENENKYEDCEVCCNRDILNGNDDQNITNQKLMQEQSEYNKNEINKAECYFPTNEKELLNCTQQKYSSKPSDSKNQFTRAFHEQDTIMKDEMEESQMKNQSSGGSERQKTYFRGDLKSFNQDEIKPKRLEFYNKSIGSLNLQQHGNSRQLVQGSYFQQQKQYHNVQSKHRQKQDSHTSMNTNQPLYHFQQQQHHQRISHTDFDNNMGGIKLDPQCQNKLFSMDQSQQQNLHQQKQQQFQVQLKQQLQNRKQQYSCQKRQSKKEGLSFQQQEEKQEQNQSDFLSRYQIVDDSGMIQSAELQNQHQGVFQRQVEQMQSQQQQPYNHHEQQPQHPKIQPTEQPSILPINNYKKFAQTTDPISSSPNLENNINTQSLIQQELEEVQVQQDDNEDKLEILCQRSVIRKITNDGSGVRRKGVNNVKDSQMVYCEKQCMKLVRDNKIGQNGDLWLEIVRVMIGMSEQNDRLQPLYQQKNQWKRHQSKILLQFPFSSHLSHHQFQQNIINRIQTNQNTQNRILLYSTQRTDKQIVFQYDTKQEKFVGEYVVPTRLKKQGNKERNGLKLKQVRHQYKNSVDSFFTMNEQEICLFHIPRSSNRQTRKMNKIFTYRNINFLESIGDGQKKRFDTFCVHEDGDKLVLGMNGKYVKVIIVGQNNALQYQYQLQQQQQQSTKLSLLKSHKKHLSNILPLTLYKSNKKPSNLQYQTTQTKPKTKPIHKSNFKKPSSSSIKQQTVEEKTQQNRSYKRIIEDNEYLEDSCYQIGYIKALNSFNIANEDNLLFGKRCDTQSIKKAKQTTNENGNSFTCYQQLNKGLRFINVQVQYKSQFQNNKIQNNMLNKANKIVCLLSNNKRYVIDCCQYGSQMVNGQHQQLNCFQNKLRLVNRSLIRGISVFNG